MKAIVATNNLGYIGKDGKLMWRCSADFKHFKALTMGGVLIVGATTFKNDMPNGLPGRELVVVSSTGYSIEEAVSWARERAKQLDEISGGAYGEVWVIGGASIYKQLIHLCDEIHLSIINNNDVGDVKFEITEDYKGKVFKYYFEPNAPK